MSTDEKKTVELDKPPAWAIAMAEGQAKGFERIDSRLGAIETTVDTLVEDKQVSNLRMARIEKRMDTFEERADQSSMRAKEPSAHDLEAKAELANGRVRIEALEKKVDVIDAKTDAQTEILNRLEKGAAKLAANPIVRSIAVMLGTAALTWLAAHGGVR